MISGGKKRRLTAPPTRGRYLRRASRSLSRSGRVNHPLRWKTTPPPPTTRLSLPVGPRFPRHAPRHPGHVRLRIGYGGRRDASARGCARTGHPLDPDRGKGCNSLGSGACGDETRIAMLSLDMKFPGSQPRRPFLYVRPPPHPPTEPPIAPIAPNKPRPFNPSARRRFFSSNF
jgi:hypothetical protein